MSCEFSDPHSLTITLANNVNCVLHFHHSLEFVLAADGQVVMEINGKEYTLEQGDAVWIAPYAVHSFRTPGHSVCYIMEFLPDKLEEFSKWIRGHGSVSPLIRLRRFTYEYLVSMLSGERTVPDGNKAGHFEIVQPCEAYLRTYLQILSREFTDICAWTDRNEKPDDVLLAVLEYMEENYASPITLESTAAFIGIRPETLARKIRSGTGETFLRNLHKLRVYHACIELREGTSSTEAAYETGFGSISSFNRVFRELTGLTPSEYRVRA